MKLQIYPTRAEWEEIAALGPGVRNYRGKRTLFYNGEELVGDGDEYLIYDEEERNSWQVIIVLPGVEIIPEVTFNECDGVKVVIMANSVRSIQECAFDTCESLEFIKLSTNLEYIGEWAFIYCVSLTSIFIPESCREIHEGAFSYCPRLLIFNVPQTTELGEQAICNTALIEASTFETDKIGHYQDNVAVNEWIKSINDGEELALHRICTADTPNTEEVYGYVKDNGLHVMKLPNSIGITPSQYLAANPDSEIEEGKLAKRYVLEMMGEIVQEQA